MNQNQLNNNTVVMFGKRVFDKGYINISQIEGAHLSLFSFIYHCT